MVTTFAFSNFGSGGNSSSGNPRILKKLWPLRIEAAFLPSTSIGYFARRQLADDGEEPPRRQSGGAFLFDLRFETAAHAHVEIGRGQMDFAAFGLEQNVRKNRQRRAGADDVLHLLQTFEQLFFGDAEFHVGAES